MDRGRQHPTGNDPEVVAATSTGAEEATALSPTRAGDAAAEAVPSTGADAATETS